MAATMRSSAVSALLDGDTDAARRARNRGSQLEKLFSLFLRLVFTTYRNPRLNQAVGVGTGFPLIGYRSAAQDVSLMAGIADDIATIAIEQVADSLDDPVADDVQSVHFLLERSARHASDTLDVATHLAFRESPDVVRNDTP
ncbi:MAG: phosphate uptake regulator [Natronomonas sp.]|jgi:phosphate uptake regulator|uniref:hypothetical protein n=1 Tax=Natronomonas sp. TaxID=2184060 RepID=UPI00398A49CE